MMTKTYRIGFIGAGNMASAIVGGLIRNGLSPSQLYLSDPNETTLEQIANQWAVNTTSSNLASVTPSDVIILAVKPQVMDKVCESISTADLQNKLIISIAAGITLDNLTQWLKQPNQVPMVRAMPNTPALVNEGATGFFSNSAVDEDQKQITNELFSSIGLCVEVAAEADIDAVTAISGSGPAYFFYLMEAMIEAGENIGLAPDVAQRLALQTAKGAATLALKESAEPKELRRRVTSPGGTTEAAINTFENQGVKQSIQAGIIAARQKAIELASSD